MGLARSVGLRDSGTVGAEHRTWVGVFVAVLAGMLAVAIPLALVAGVPVDEAIRGTLGPVGDVLVPLVSLVILPVALLGSLLVWMIGVLRPSGGPQPEPPGGAIGPTVIDWQKALGPSASETAILGLVPIVVALAGAFLLVRRFLGRPGSSDVGRDVTEIRENERPTGGIRLRLPRLPAPRRRHVPHTASEAYLASLDVLAASPELARLDEETPSEHARRVRADAIGPSLSRLAADYVLVEFGRRTLAPSEHRRAVERWRRIRSMLDRRT